MFWIGCHLSSAKGYLAMGKEAVTLGTNVFQFFTRNPRGGSVKALDRADIDAFCAFAKARNASISALSRGFTEPPLGFLVKN